MALVLEKLVQLNIADKVLTEVGPSIPAQIAGFSELPQPGDIFEFALDTSALKKHQKLSSLKSPNDVSKILGG